MNQRNPFLTDPAAEAVRVTGDMIDAVLTGIEAGDAVGKTAKSWLAANRDRFVGLGVSTLRGFVENIRGGTPLDVTETRLKLVEAMTYDEALEFHRLSAEALRGHAKETFRLGAVLDEVARIGERAMPLVIGVLGKLVGI